MNCHGGNHENHGQEAKKGHFKHMLLMVLCCAIPAVLLLLMPVLKINSTALKNILPYGVALICPLMHIAMIPLLFKKDKNKNQNQNKDSYAGQIE